MPEYNPKDIEKKWQEEWEKSGIYKTDDNSSKPKFYILDMFPYPSGEGLHVGHPKGYIATDVVSRMKRMQGFNVLHPMGWDAFGLPAENYAIKHKVHPRIAVEKNVKRFKEQLSIIGLDYDWSREINTTDPKFYKWTQWIFLKLLEKGLAYESNEPVNWCPFDKTVLANEDVEDGKCERCGSVVEKRPIRQWVLRITDYADRLLDDLDATDYEMPLLIDKVNPHQPGAPLVKRRVAHAIVYDPKERKFLIIRNKKFGWDTVVIGGIEGGESVEAAARREVAEETGYTDLEFKRVLGSATEAHYHTPHKGENRVAIAQAAYFELKSDKRVDVNKENLTAGEASHNEILWVGAEDFKPGKLVNSELPIWLERLSVEAYYDKKHPSVPHFKEVMGVSAYREGAPVVEREAVAAIVKHWKDDSYMGLKWKKVAWQTIITGGVEAGQTPEEAAIEEIRQETGYQNIRFVKKLGQVDASFYHVPKGVNRFGHFHVLYLELVDGERKELSEEEKANHDLHWVPKGEMGTFLSVVAQTYIWNTLFLGKPSHYIELAKPLLDWPESIKEAQRNWIGRSYGMQFSSPVKDTDMVLETFSAHFEAFKADTFVVIAPDHKLLPELVKGVPDAEKVLAAAKEMTEKRNRLGRDVVAEPEGIFTGRYTLDPVGNGELPIWVANYALADYGTGIVKCSAHDERDFNFAKKYGIKLKPVLFPEDAKLRKKVENLEVCYSDMQNGILAAPAEFNGRKAGDVREEIVAYLEKHGLAKRKTTYRIRDWVFSRQRYWGEPIPVLHDGDKVIPLLEKDLPLVLPDVESYEPTGTAESPLANISEWMNVEVGGRTLRRESNTMPQWAGSSWYWLRFMDPHNDAAPVSKENEKKWGPVDIYVGGDHAVRHLIYARFWHKFLYDIGVVSTKEPFSRLEFLGFILAEDGRKMSKRWGNVINPDDMVGDYGADSFRTYEMFIGPFEGTVPWSTSGLVGVRRFIERVWRASASVKEHDNPLLESALHQTVKKVSEDIDAFKFNTAVSQLMIFINAVEKAGEVGKNQFEMFLKLLAPFAPHITEELWRELGHAESIHTASWPQYDESKLVSGEVTIVVQVDGKVRSKFAASSTISEAEALAEAKKLPEVAKWMGERGVRKSVYVPGKLINFVLT